VVEARKNWIRVSGLNGLRGSKVEHRIVLGAAFREGSPRSPKLNGQLRDCRIVHRTAVFWLEKPVRGGERKVDERCQLASNDLFCPEVL
jgi:hypothetical protein